MPAREDKEDMGVCGWVVNLDKKTFESYRFVKAGAGVSLSSGRLAME